jgi:hypothetical protein
MAEQLTLNQLVQGSSPWWITYFFSYVGSGFPHGDLRYAPTSPWWITYFFLYVGSGFPHGDLRYAPTRPWWITYFF